MRTGHLGRTAAIGCLAVLLGAALCPAGAADRCKLLRSQPVPVKMEGMRPVISARINGVEARFIIDTGSFFDFLSPAAAARLKLPLSYAPPWYYIGGVGGSFVPEIATAKSFSVAGITAHRAKFLVGNNGFGGVEDGVLGENLFRISDIELDFGDGVLRFVQPRHCGHARLAYWATSTQPVAEVDLRSISKRQPDLLGKAYVNGHKIEVLFDTGAARTILSLAAAKRAGITPASPGVVPAGAVGGMGSRTIKVWSAPLAKFQIGDEAVEHTHVLIGDVRLGNLGADMMLGADFFLAHHVYVAYSQNKLYFTYNGGPVFDLNARRPLQAASSPRTAGQAPAAPVAAGGGPPSDAPAGAAGYLRRGMAETARGELSQAIADLTRACELAADADCHYRRGLAYWRNHDPRRALADFDDALKLAPGDYAAHLARAELQLPTAHAGIAGDLDAVSRLAPAQSGLRLRLAALYDSIGRFPAAAHQLDLWIQYHPRDRQLPQALGFRCGVRAAADVQLHRALSDCNRAIHAKQAASHSVFWRLTHRAAPGPGWMLCNRSLVYLRLGDLDQAIADDDSALGQIRSRQNKARAYPLYLRGLAELRQGLKARGQADIAAARKLRPGTDEHYAKMGLTP
jgi:tetratricopeptide (TPR) repeat protein